MNNGMEWSITMIKPYQMAFLNIIPDMIPDEGDGAWEWIENYGWRCATTHSGGHTIHCTRDGDRSLYEYLRSKDLVISYNWLFDSLILSSVGDPRNLGRFSMMHAIEDSLGYRISLQNISNSNGHYGTRNGLPKFLRSNPTIEECKGYNINKIESMQFVLDRALNKGWLNYYQPGEERGIKKLDTRHWEHLINGSRMSF